MYIIYTYTMYMSDEINGIMEFRFMKKTIIFLFSN